LYRSSFACQNYFPGIVWFATIKTPNITILINNKKISRAKCELDVLHYYSGSAGWPKTYRIPVMDPHDLDHGPLDFLSMIRVSVRVRSPWASSALASYTAPRGESRFCRDVLQMALHRNAATVDTSPEPQILQDTISR
jgi:hypothetical protein